MDARKGKIIIIFLTIMAVVSALYYWQTVKVVKEVKVYVKESQALIKMQYMDIKNLQSDTAYYRALLGRTPSQKELDSLKRELIKRDGVIVKQDLIIDDVTKERDSLDNFVRSLQYWDGSNTDKPGDAKTSN